MKEVLISLHRGYGLGDAVKMSAVLRHVAKYRPDWRFDFQAEVGRYCVGAGIASRCFAYGEPYPCDRYDAEVQILLFNNWYGFTDRPNTQVGRCLKDRFDLPWDRTCGEYLIRVSPESLSAVQTLLGGDPRRFVALHYEGDSAQIKKNLTHEQVYEICRRIESLGYEPLILDWRKRSQLPERYRRLHTPRHWGGDAEMVTAVISQCSAFIGIDSGPAKCASATSVPTMVVWHGHHPAEFHDPAPNTTHLCPVGYHDLAPVCGNPGVVKWYEANYNTRLYRSDLVVGVEAWLTGILR